MVNKSFNMKLWNVAFYKTRASCSYFWQVHPPSHCPNALNVQQSTQDSNNFFRDTIWDFTFLLNVRQYSLNKSGGYCQRISMFNIIIRTQIRLL